MLSTIRLFWSLAKRIEGLVILETNLKRTIDELGDRLSLVEQRMTVLEVGQSSFVSEAKSAATASATMIASGIVYESATRTARLESRLDALEQAVGPSRKLLPGASI